MTVTIADGPIEIELLPRVGARLHRLRAFGHDLLRTPEDASTHQADPFGWGAYVMAPWCNRIAAVPTVVGGELVALPANFEDGTAIHGQVYAAAWHAATDGALTVRGGGNGWPWPYECRIQFAIRDAVVTIALSLTNLAKVPMPAGIGLHPWFRRPLDVRIDASRVIASNSDPEAISEPVAGRLDLRTMQPMPPDLDAAWTALGDQAVELRWPALGVSATLRARSGGELWIVAASPAALDAVAIEPQTHAPYGLGRLLRHAPGSMPLLDPGASAHLVTELAFRQH